MVMNIAIAAMYRESVTLNLFNSCTEMKLYYSSSALTRASISAGKGEKICLLTLSSIQKYIQSRYIIEKSAVFEKWQNGQ